MELLDSSYSYSEVNAKGVYRPLGAAHLYLSSTTANLRFFGRADFWISLSRAKFDEEVDFEIVRP